MGRGSRFAAVSAVAGLGLLLSAGSASATFHLMKVREISAGTNGSDDSYVEVQMYAPFQSFLSNGAKVAVCNNTCSLVPAEFSGFSNVANGNSQDTVVFGDSGVPGGSKDFNVNLNLQDDEAGGAVCYVSEPGYTDCVSWGNFNANSTLTTNYDASADPGSPAMTLTSGMALRRSISAGCPTALEPGDDSNNSAADFAAATPNPRPNSVAPTEMTCGRGAPTGSPTPPGAPSTAKKKKCKKHKKSQAGGGAPTSGGGAPAYSAKKKCRKKK
jgi:hypothetical protein